MVLIGLLASTRGASPPEEVQKENAAFFEAQRALWPFAHPGLPALQATRRRVYAHRHLFPISYDNRRPQEDRYSQLLVPGGARSAEGGGFLRVRPLARPPRTEPDWRLRDAMWDIRKAKALGVDGFWFNLGMEDYKEEDAWPALIEYLTAAERLQDGFTIAPNLDCAAGEKIAAASLADQLIDHLGRHRKLASPALQRVDGRLVVATFAANRCSPRWWQDFVWRMAERGQPVFLVACALPWQPAFPERYAAVAEAFADWGIRNQPAYDYDAPEVFGGMTRDKIAVAMIRASDVRYKPGTMTFWESHGSRTLREHWAAAIRSQRVDWAQLLTWNDHGEDTGFGPNSAKQFSFYDLSAYHLVWFKTGTAPAITRDALYYFHRILPVSFVPPDGRRDTVRRKDSPPAVDEIEVVTLLTAPGIVEVETVVGRQEKAMPAGLASMATPLPPAGRPVFRLRREGCVVIQIESAFAVQQALPQDDLVYRGGGSLRMAEGRRRPAAGEAACGAAAAEQAAGEPVWLAR